jgi:calcineurin-like phosphoesterase family protein
LSELRLKGVDPREVFFTADMHLGHHWIAEDDKRANRMGLFGKDLVRQMNEELIRQHNLVVPPSGLVFNVGDYTYTSMEEGISILARLNGTKHLICGNHDVEGKTVMRQAWDGFYEYRLILLLEEMDHPLIKGSSMKIVLDHYPIEDWDHAFRGAWHLHGHTHAMSCIDHPNPSMVRYDVGVDSRDRVPRRYKLDGYPTFAPFSLDELLRLTPGGADYSKVFRPAK